MATNENQPKAPSDKSAAEYQSEANKAVASKSATEQQSAPAKKAAPAKQQGTGTPDVRASRSGSRDADNPGAGVADELRESYNARTQVPGAPGVDARLDNRRGNDRPVIGEVKPQQIDGPDITEQAEWTRNAIANRDANTAEGRAGMFSAGPHGRSDDSLREGGKLGENKTLYGTESLTEEELADSEDREASEDLHEKVAGDR